MSVDVRKRVWVCQWEVQFAKHLFLLHLVHFHSSFPVLFESARRAREIWYYAVRQCLAGGQAHVSTCQHKAERLIAGNTKQWKQILRIAKTHTLLPIMALFSLLLPAAHVLMFQLA